MSKRKAPTVLFQSNKRFASAGIANMLQAQNPVVVQQIANNRAAAIIRREAAMQRNNLQRATPTETGFVDTISAQYKFNTTGTIALVAAVGQGAGVQQRIGKRIFWKSLQFRGLAFANTTTTFADGALILVYDKRPTGALPAITDILNTSTASSFNNDDNSGRFQIVRRWEFMFSGNTTTPQTGKEIAQMDEFVKFRRVCNYKSAGTGLIGDIEEGALYVVTVGSAIAGTADASVTMGIRTRFTEV